MENFNNVPSQGKFGDSVAVVNENFMLAQQKMEELQAQYDGLTQSDIIVGSLPASGIKNTIYRVPNATSYSDYMWNGTQFIKMAEYDNAIDDEPTPDSNNLVKSGSLFQAFNGFTLERGSLDNSSGEPISRTNRLRCSFIKVDGWFICNINPDYQYLVFYYNDNQVFQSKESAFSLGKRSIFYKGYIRIIIGKYPDDAATITLQDDCSLKVFIDSNIIGRNIESPLYSLFRSQIPQLGKVSIIGDSISTFEGYLVNGYPSHYPTYSADVKKVYDTWWDLLLNAIGCTLEVNAAYDGSCVSNARASEGKPDLYDRANVVGSPDTLIIMLGTNDSNKNVSLGDYSYDTPIADLSESEFIPAYIKGIKAIQENYPNIKVILMIAKMKDAYNSAIRNIAEHYGFDCIDVSNYSTDSGNVHPNKLGMEDILRKIAWFYNQKIGNIAIVDDVHQQQDALPSPTGTFKLVNGFTMEQGGFDSTTGAPKSLTNRIRSSFIKVDGQYAIEVGDGYQAMVYRYDSNETFISKDNSFFTGKRIYDTYSGKVRILIAKSPDNTQSINVNSDYVISLYKRYFKDELVYFHPISFGVNSGFDITNGYLSITGGLYVYLNKETRKSISTSLFGSIQLQSSADTKKLVAMYGNNAPVLKDMDATLNDNEYLIAHINYDGSTYYMSTAGMVGVEGVNSKRLSDSLGVMPMKNDEIRFFQHRGVHNSSVPQDSVYSVMMAHVFGIKYVETDVIYTSDGHAVMHHDYTINDDMRNADGTEIAEQDWAINDHTLAELLEFRYNSDNPKYRTKISTLEEYVEACAAYNVVPIIQTDTNVSEGDDKELHLIDIQFLCKKLGANWIQYNGNPDILRQVSNDVLYLDSSNQSNFNNIVNKFKKIGGRCGVSYTSWDNFNNYQSVRNQVRMAGYEIMASFSATKNHIPDAINDGASIILSDNIGKDICDTEASSLVDFSDFTYTGTVSDGILHLNQGQTVEYTLDKKGIYNIIIECDGSAFMSMPVGSGTVGIDLTSGYIKFPILYTRDDSMRKMTIWGGSSELDIRNIFIMYSKN